MRSVNCCIIISSQSALHATETSVWLPYTTLDHLLAALSEAPEASQLAPVRGPITVLLYAHP